MAIILCRNEVMLSVEDRFAVLLRLRSLSNKMRLFNLGNRQSKISSLYVLRVNASSSDLFELGLHDIRSM